MLAYVRTILSDIGSQLVPMRFMEYKLDTILYPPLFLYICTSQPSYPLLTLDLGRTDRTKHKMNGPDAQKDE